MEDNNDINDALIFDGLSLVELALRGRWNTAIQRARRHPEEITEQNEDGLNTLHLAAVNFPPAHLFAELLRVVNRNNSSNNNNYVYEACQARDHSGMTPLLCATALFAPLEMIQILVDACPKAAVLRAKDAFGGTALHHICSRSARRGFSSLRRALARAEILLEVEPSLVKVPDDSGMLPIHTLCHEYQDDISSYWLSQEPDVQLGILRFDVEGLWLFFATLLAHQYHCDHSSDNHSQNSGSNHRNTNVLHQIVNLVPPPPMPLVILACRRQSSSSSSSLEGRSITHQQDMLVYEQDANGNTPLHLAVQRRLWDIACFLIRKFPDCTEIKNNKGQVPLEVAAETSTSFNRCLYKLVSANPRALKRVIDQDNLFPRLFAHILRSARRSNDDDYLQGPSALFNILRLRPGLVGESI